MSPEVFDKVLELKIPDLKDRKEYLSQYFKDKHLFKNLNTDEMIEEIGLKTEGFKYADIEKYLKKAQEHLYQIINTKLSRKPSEKNLRNLLNRPGFVL